MAPEALGIDSHFHRISVKRLDELKRSLGDKGAP